MVNVIPTIQPFTYQASTAFQERVQLANKVNEVIDALNQIGDIEDLQTQIDTINSTITQIQADVINNDTEISTIQSRLNTLIQEVNGLLSEVVNEIVVDSPGYGQVRVRLIHEDESETASNALQIPVIQDGGITLISGTTDRSFKIQYITMDGVAHTTNDFVIPEGGGTDVTITSISILQGDTANDIKFQVGLSDGSAIQSNSYPIPQATITPATTSQIGGIKVGRNLSVTADGTLSVNMTTIGTAAAAASIKWTADPSKVTLHADSLNGSEFTEDIPPAGQGGAGTIDAAAYQKLQDVPTPDTIATDAEISDLQEQITGLKLSESGTNGIMLNGDSVKVIRTISGTVDENKNLIITVNGVSGAGIPLPKAELKPIATCSANGSAPGFVVYVPTTSSSYIRQETTYKLYNPISLTCGENTITISNGNLDDPEFIEFVENSPSGYGRLKQEVSESLYVLNNNSTVISNVESLKDEIVSGLSDVFSSFIDGHYYIVLGSLQQGRYRACITNLGMEFDVSNNVISNATFNTENLIFAKSRVEDTGVNLYILPLTLSTKGFLF